jgi:hypothetical protein
MTGISLQIIGKSWAGKREQRAESLYQCVYVCTWRSMLAEISLQINWKVLCNVIFEPTTNKVFFEIMCHVQTFHFSHSCDTLVTPLPLQGAPPLPAPVAPGRARPQHERGRSCIENSPQARREYRDFRRSGVGAARPEPNSATKGSLTLLILPTLS